MDKKYFLEKETQLKGIIANAKQGLKTLEADYIEANREFDIDEKVVIVTRAHEVVWKKKGADEKYIEPEKRRFAFVDGFEVWSGEIKYELRKCKKDGTKSEHRDYCNNRFSDLETIKKIV